MADIVRLNEERPSCEHETISIESSVGGTQLLPNGQTVSTSGERVRCQDCGTIVGGAALVAQVRERNERAKERHRLRRNERLNELAHGDTYRRRDTPGPFSQGRVTGSNEGGDSDT